jgi:hypothetical protein
MGCKLTFWTKLISFSRLERCRICIEIRRSPSSWRNSCTYARYLLLSRTHVLNLLQVLEGITCLTTSRIGTFDVFQSRSHVPLRYEPFSFWSHRQGWIQRAGLGKKDPPHMEREHDKLVNILRTEEIRTIIRSAEVVVVSQRETLGCQHFVLNEPSDTFEMKQVQVDRGTKNIRELVHVYSTQHQTSICYSGKQALWEKLLLLITSTPLRLSWCAYGYQ